MRTSVLRGTVLARAAVLGLAIGLAALAGLALRSSDQTTEATTWVRTADEVSEQWSLAFLSLSVEDQVLDDYLYASGKHGRGPLQSAVGSTGASMVWLTTHGTADDRAAASSTLETYHSYTEMLAEFVARSQAVDPVQLRADAEPIAMVASGLQKQVVNHISRERLETNAYLTQVEQDNQQFRLAAMVLGGVDLLLLALCGLVLLSHQRRTERRALRDGLTGLANRVLLGDRLRQALRGADRHGEPVGLLLLDLNGFKQVNDTLGHHAGDLLLQEVATRLTGAVRDCDTVARLGGDEFAVVLPRMAAAVDVELIAGRLLSAVQRPLQLAGTTVDVRVSIGAAVYPLDSADADELMQHADSAMYEAKRERCGTARYQPGVAAPYADEAALLVELRRALDEHQLVLHYQPKARTDGSQVCGVEALVRWQHPVRGLLPPAEFIPAAENSDLIHPLTHYVLTAALEQHRAWRQQGVTLPVAVNITAHSLLDPDFPGTLAALLGEYGTAPDQLTLELTETAAITDSDRGSAMLGRLRGLGVRVSIDDFGAGYSSMAYLHDLPLDELKIDRKLVAAAQSSAGSTAILRAIVELARALRLDVVAEGVEDRSTLEALERLGCAVAQGYYLCRPMPAAALTQWLAERPAQAPGLQPLSSAGAVRPVPDVLSRIATDRVRPNVPAL